MMDFEVVKLGGSRSGEPVSYAMQVSKRVKGEIIPEWFSVNDAQRHFSKAKLMKAFEKGDFQPLPVVKTNATT